MGRASPDPYAGLASYPLFHGWAGYRLGDMMFDKVPFGRAASDGGEAFHLSRFPDSICSRYMRATRAKADFHVLATIIRSFPASSEFTPAPGSLVVPLRVGTLT